MDAVLKKIHYNPECFSKIVEDFEDFLERAEPGVFRKKFDDIIQSPVFPEEHLICVKIHTQNMEEAISELKNNLERYLNDFDDIKKILQGAEAEDKVEEWLDELPCLFYTFNHIVIEILWRANWQRYTTALRDTGKASPRSEN